MPNNIIPFDNSKLEISNGVYLLGHEDHNQIEHIAALHQKLLPNSPLSLMGKNFLKKFYYSNLVKTGLINCFYYVFEHNVVGFIVATTEPSKFMKKGILKNFFSFIKLVCLNIFLNPGKILQIYRAYQLESALNRGSQGEAAVLSFGVLESYRRRSFIRKTGKMISNELFEKVIFYMRESGMDSVRLLIDSGNIEAILFYLNYGCSVEKVQMKGVSLIAMNCSLLND